MKLAEKLVYLRKEKRLSQLKLAELMNVSRQAVSRWEVGAATPSTENLRYLSSLYGVSMEYLLDEDEDGPGEMATAPAGAGGRRLEKKTVLKMAAAAVFIFALGAGAAVGFMGLGDRESGGDAQGEIGALVGYDGYTIMEPDEEVIGGRVYGYGIVDYDGGLIGGQVHGYAVVERDDGEIVGMISHPALEK